MTRTCSHPDCDRILTGKGDLCRSHRMKALHKDPEFSRQCSERSRANMVALRNNPAFIERMSAALKARRFDPRYDPLASLAPEERAEYDRLRRDRKFIRAAVLTAIGRQDLIAGADQ